MDKKYLDEFLASNPTESEKQAVWDQHLKDIGYKDGMIPCCCGNCYEWGWGTPKNGVWYLSGHTPNVVAASPKNIMSLPRKSDPYWWARNMGWFLQVSLVVALVAFLFGFVFDLMIGGA